MMKNPLVPMDIHQFIDDDDDDDDDENDRASVFSCDVQS